MDRTRLALGLIVLAFAAGALWYWTQADTTAAGVLARTAIIGFAVWWAWPLFQTLTLRTSLPWVGAGLFAFWRPRSAWAVFLVLALILRRD